MNTQIKSAIILVDNLLDNPIKYNRESLSKKLQNEGLPHTESTITRLLNFIDMEFGIRIKTDRSNFTFKIDEEETSQDFIKQYYQYKNLYVRNLLQKASTDNKVMNEYVSFGFATKNKNMEYMPELLNAIIQSRKVRLHYLPFYENKTLTYEVSPLFIKEYLNRWYLITEKLEDGRHPIFAIDRIEDYEVLKTKFKRSNTINPKTFEHTIGVSFDNPVKKVKLWVSKYQYHYFETLPFHASQKMEQETKDGFIISFEITLNYELQQWILFFGDSIKVLEPEPLKKQIMENLKSNLKQYGK